MTKSIDENKYFAESKKAIQIAVENERLLGKKMPTVDKLQLARDYKKNTKEPNEYKELEKLEKELEMKIRFNQLNEPAVPEEQQEKIRKNVDIEEQELNKVLNELKAQLRLHYKYVEDEIIPLIVNIEKLEQLSAVPSQIKLLLKAVIGENTAFKVEGLMRGQNYSSNATVARNLIHSLEKSINRMQALEVPYEIKDGEK